MILLLAPRQGRKPTLRHSDAGSNTLPLVTTRWIRRVARMSSSGLPSRTINAPLALFDGSALGDLLHHTRRHIVAADKASNGDSPAWTYSSISRWRLCPGNRLIGTGHDGNAGAMQPPDQRQAVVEPRALARGRVSGRSEAVQTALRARVRPCGSRARTHRSAGERSGQQLYSASVGSMTVRCRLSSAMTF